MARFNFLMMQAGIELSTPAVVVVSAVYKEHNGARGPTRTQAQCVMLVITMYTNGAPEWGDTHCQGLTSLGQT